MSIVSVRCVLLRYRHAGTEKEIHRSIDLYVNSTRLGVHIGRSVVEDAQPVRCQNRIFFCDFGFQGISDRPPPNLNGVYRFVPELLTGNTVRTA